MADSLPVVIWCGGEGTRLREETEFKPKPMVTVGGLPILYHIMKGYAKFGHTTFILCLGYKGEVIKEFFATSEVLHHEPPMDLTAGRVHCSKEGWDVIFADTGLKTLTGGRLWKVREHLKNAPYFLCTYGDGLTDADLNAEIAFAKKQGTACTLLGTHPRSKWGMVEPGAGGRVKRFIEKPVLRDFVNGGFYVFTPKLFDYLRDDERLAFEDGPIEQMVKDGQVSMYEHDGFWYGMDTYKDYLELNEMWTAGKTPWKKW